MVQVRRPHGFNHDLRQIMMKGDRDTTFEAPADRLVGRNSILVGFVSGNWPTTR